MNEFEIERAYSQLKDTPVVGRLARWLMHYCETINSNSDGWAYWTLGTSKAKKAEAILEECRPDNKREWSDRYTEADVEIAIKPMALMCRKQGWLTLEEFDAETLKAQLPEWRIRWCACPTSRNTHQIIYVRAADQEAARAVAKNHIERTQGVGWISWDTIEPAPPVPPGEVVSR